MLERHTGLSEESLHDCAAEVRKLLEVDASDAKYKHQTSVRMKYHAQVCEGRLLKLNAPRTHGASVFEKVASLFSMGILGGTDRGSTSSLWMHDAESS